jgi:hypothetical protein
LGKKISFLKNFYLGAFAVGFGEPAVLVTLYVWWSGDQLGLAGWG